MELKLMGFNMKKLQSVILLSILIFGLILSNSFSESIIENDKIYLSESLDGTSITIDGMIDDWVGIDGVNITLKPARIIGHGNHEMVFKSIHNENKIYFLIMVEDDYYFYNMATGISHRNAAALAVAFPIDEGALVQYMGGSNDTTFDELNTTTGEVDIMHWQLDTLAGVVTGGSRGLESRLGDGVANLDDEYSTTPWDRHDDDDTASNNLWSGSWSHTGDSTNGSTGWWIFELSRDLASSDIHDFSFVEGDTTDVVVAYWSPNETTENKWTNDGHYTNSNNVIIMSLGPNNISYEISGVIDTTTTTETTSTSDTINTTSDTLLSSSTINDTPASSSTTNDVPYPINIVLVLFWLSPITKAKFRKE